MISNYHTASSSGPGGAYYTFSGFENEVAPSSQRANAAGGKNAGKKGARKGMRGFKGWGRGRLSSGDTIESDGSNGVQSLTYSAGSSIQSAGETTASSEFSGILRVLDAADKKDLAKGEGVNYYGRGGGSVASSLNYSDTDGETSQMGRSKMSRGTSVASNYSTDYSTDQESQLEGAKLISMLLEEPKNKPVPDSLLGPSRGYSSDDEEEEEPFDMRFETSRVPVRRNKVRPAPHSAASPAATVKTSSPSRNIELTGSKSSQSATSKDKSVSSRTSSSSAPTKHRNVATATGREYNGFGTHRTLSKPKTTTKVETKSWPCGMEALEDAIPQSVKTFLRPFLCGLI